MLWVIVRYHPVTFFSLRPYNATSSGGQTLISPTAFAFKMALLNATIQTAGLDAGRERFPVIRDLAIALDLPDRISVLKSFAKIRRQAEFKKAETREQDIARLRDRKQYPFQSTIAYRELVQFGDPLSAPSDNAIAVACMPSASDLPSWLGPTLQAINYLGKRGSFLQSIGAPTVVDNLAPRFTIITRDSTDFLMNSTLQMLDDCSASMTFEHADIYSSKRITLGRERVLRHVALPYELTRSSRGYSLYERIAEEA
ncbi:MAG TPA: hypothetical protein VFU63_12220 [Ktedonobacterales bacterium]|nr:hypothetical protein [Ktedonobacterales bacterium]